MIAATAAGRLGQRLPHLQAGEADLLQQTAPVVGPQGRDAAAHDLDGVPSGRRQCVAEALVPGKAAAQPLGGVEQHWLRSTRPAKRRRRWARVSELGTHAECRDRGG